MSEAYHTLTMIRLGAGGAGHTFYCTVNTSELSSLCVMHRLVVRPYAGSQVIQTEKVNGLPVAIMAGYNLTATARSIHYPYI